MFARVFRLTERTAQLIVKICAWAGYALMRTVGRLTSNVNHRFARSTSPAAPPQSEGQVRSLSGLAAILLAAVSALLFWATSTQAANNPVVQFFTTNQTPGAPQEADLAGSEIVAAPPPSFLEMGETVVFSMYTGGQQDLFALESGASEPVRLTDNPADDRSPAWSPDGQRIAFASQRNANWDLYILEVETGEVTRLTSDPAFEANPSWSPDGQWLAYEGYYDGNLDIFIIKVDGSEGPYPVTRSPGADHSPAWTTSPAGREIAYVSHRDGHQDIYLLFLDDPSEDKAVNITNTPDLDEDAPTWGGGGSLLAYSVVENGVPLVYAKTLTDPNAEPFLVGQGETPVWSPDGGQLLFLAERPTGSLFLIGQFGAWETSVQAFALPGYASDPDWSPTTLPENPQGSLAFALTAPTVSAYEEALWPRESPNDPYRLISLSGVIAESPLLSDRVDASFIALKEYILQAAGWDFLGRLDAVWWPRERLVEPGQEFRNWHKAGRAFDIVQTYNQGTPAQIELVPHYVGPDIYWELYIRCAVQDGTLGEPLRALPWDFSARTSGDRIAYEAGGQFKSSIPGGYYINFTQIARVYGWYPVPSASSWRYNWPGVLYWQYEKRDGLDWWSAMLELYKEDELQETFAFLTPVPDAELPTLPPVTIEGPDGGGDTAVQETPTPTITPTPAPIAQ